MARARSTISSTQGKGLDPEHPLQRGRMAQRAQPVAGCEAGLHRVTVEPEVVVGKPGVPQEGLAFGQVCAQVVALWQGEEPQDCGLGDVKAAEYFTYADSFAQCGAKLNSVVPEC